MSETPKRIQRKRTKGWRMPAGAIYVGRPTKWGNHIRIDPAEIEGTTPAEARRLAHRDAVIGYEKSILWNIDADDFKAAVREWADGVAPLLAAVERAAVATAVQLTAYSRDIAAVVNEYKPFRRERERYLRRRRQTRATFHGK